MPRLAADSALYSLSDIATACQTPTRKVRRLLRQEGARLRGTRPIMVAAGELARCVPEVWENIRPETPERPPEKSGTA